MADLLSIPPELQMAIVEYPTSRTDLNSVSRTCKLLSAIATPYLYREMTPSVAMLKRCAEEDDGFNRANMKHVRKFEVTDEVLQDWQSVSQPLCELLKTVPTDKLEYLLYVYHR
jgi:hypothetical protein